MSISLTSKKKSFAINAFYWNYIRRLAGCYGYDDRVRPYKGRAIAAALRQAAADPTLTQDSMRQKLLDTYDIAELLDGEGFVESHVCLARHLPTDVLEFLDSADEFWVEL